MKAPRHTLYCFVDGSDLQETAPLIESRCSELAASNGWRYVKLQVVNRQLPRTSDMRPDDLPQWELGVTMALPDPEDEPKGWFADVERVALFAGGVHVETGRDFVIGIWDAERGISEDLFGVDTERPDLQRLRQLIGVGHAS
jgi:hypothetical protein